MAAPRSLKAQLGRSSVRAHARGRRHRSRLIDRFEESARRCVSLKDLRVLLGEVTGELGFSYFALLHHASLVSPAPWRIRLDNYPRRWERELRERHRPTDDPVHMASRRTVTGFIWSDMDRIITLGPAQRRILERSRHHGLGEGFTVPANIPGEPSGSCSFAMKEGRPLRESRLLCAEQIGAHAFEAARRLAGLDAPPAPPRLRPRELQCLRLLARGKTDWEIAAILGISNETARQYVKSARAAYDVVSRTQLVVHGLRDMLIGFDDAIPPSEGMG